MGRGTASPRPLPPWGGDTPGDGTPFHTPPHTAHPSAPAASRHSRLRRSTCPLQMQFLDLPIWHRAVTIASPPGKWERCNSQADVCVVVAGGCDDCKERLDGGNSVGWEHSTLVDVYQCRCTESWPQWTSLAAAAASSIVSSRIHVHNLLWVPRLRQLTCVLHLSCINVTHLYDVSCTVFARPRYSLTT